MKIPCKTLPIVQIATTLEAVSYTHLDVYKRQGSKNMMLENDNESIMNDNEVFECIESERERCV